MGLMMFVTGLNTPSKFRKEADEFAWRLAGLFLFEEDMDLRFIEIELLPRDRDFFEIDSWDPLLLKRA